MVTCSGVNILIITLEWHQTSFDITNILNWHYISQISEAIHFYGAKAAMHITPRIPDEYDVSAGTPVSFRGDLGATSVKYKEIPEKMMEEIAEGFADQAALVKECGFDAVYLPMAYRRMLPGRFLSPLTNKRRDKYGWNRYGRR